MAGTVLLLGAALLVVVPGWTPEVFFLGIAVEARSALLVPAVAALAAAALVLRRRGRSRVAAASVVLLGAALVLALLPVWQGLRAAAAHDVPLSVAQYLTGGPDPGPPDGTVVYARPPDTPAGLLLDVWLPGPDRPAPAAGRPAVLVVHSGGWSSGERGENPAWNAWLAGRGYAVFDIDYRLMPPPRWRDAVGDVKCAAGWVAAHADRYGVDPRRLAVLGGSAGGHLALLAGYSAGDPALPPSCAVAEVAPTAVAALYPVTDLAGLADEPSPWMWAVGGSDIIPEFLGAHPREVPERARLVSPSARLDADAPPTFLAHGTADQVVPVGQSDLLADRLAAAGVPYRYVRLPGANHVYDYAWGGLATQVTRAELGRFLDAHLPAS